MAKFTHFHLKEISPLFQREIERRWTEKRKLYLLFKREIYLPFFCLSFANTDCHHQLFNLSLTKKGLFLWFICLCQVPVWLIYIRDKAKSLQLEISREILFIEEYVVFSLSFHASWQGFLTFSSELSLINPSLILWCLRFYRCQIFIHQYGKI